MLGIEKVEIIGTQLDASKVFGESQEAQATLNTILFIQRQRLGFSEPVDLSNCELTPEDLAMMQ